MSRKSLLIGIFFILALISGCIKDATIIDPNRETANIFQAAVDLLIPRIVENQSLSVDAVCGATSSSNGIKAAVADALTQALSAAGTDASALEQLL